MKTVSIKLATIEDAKSFVAVLAEHTIDLDLKSGKYTVDARSLMGIFALDWDKPVEFIINSDDKTVVDSILTDVKTWLI
jgi:phosphotransferase system HPr-like phosphotransfer protein